MVGMPLPLENEPHLSTEFGASVDRSGDPATYSLELARGPFALR